MGLKELFNAFATTPKSTAPNGNKKLFTIITDTHEFSPYLKTGVIIPTDRATIERLNIYLLGDVVERKNCSKSDLMQANNLFERLQLLYKGRYCTGNHEVNGSFDERHLIIDKHICMIHGDYVLWGDKKANEFRNEKAGQGSGFIQKMIAKRNGSISNSEAKQLAQYAVNLGCDTICLGHVHPERLFDQTINGVRVLCFPRGRTEIYI